MNSRDEAKKIVWQFIWQIYLQDIDPQSPSIKSMIDLVSDSIEAERDHCGCLGTSLSASLDDVRSEAHVLRVDRQDT